MYGGPLTQREPLGVPHRGISLTHSSNPVIFLDIECPKTTPAAAGTAHQEKTSHRILFELFSDLAPTLAANMHSLCVGGTTRLVEQRLQPVGFKGAVLHDALVGQYLVGGDVMGGGGAGFLSALGEGHGPLEVPQSELAALTAAAPSRCLHTQGLCMQYWNHTPGVVSAMVPKVASTFRIDTVERGAGAKMPSDGILIGRVVHRDAESRATTNHMLLEISKAVFHAKRENMPSSLPTIVLCVCHWYMTSTSSVRHVVVAVCGSEKKKRQSFDKLQQYVEETKGRRVSKGGHSITFSFVKMNYDEGENKITTETAGVDADVVLHKVSTLSPNAVDALCQWCDVTSHRRRCEGLPPVILIDPLDLTRLILRRSLICKRLSSPLRRLSCPIPPSWLWTLESDVLTPLVSPSSLLNDGEDAESADKKQKSRETWWVVKPDVGTGPSFAHHMIIWKGEQPAGGLPKEVCCLLPAEADAFVVQKFLSYAFPVVIKVYCIGKNVFVKAISTTPLLRNVVSNKGAPVFVDSQKKFPEEDGWKKEEERWRNYLTEGGRAHTQCTRIAKQLAAELRLTLFGFDLLLIPERLPQRVDLPSGLPAAREEEEEEVKALWRNYGSPFDDVSGSPSAMLCSALPVLVDVNYFPGFAGVENFAECILEVIESKVMEMPLQHVHSDAKDGKYSDGAYCC